MATSPSPLRLVLLARDDSSRIQTACQELQHFLNDQSGVDIVTTAIVEELVPESLDADLIVVLGGDGAILRACRQLGRHQMPILGINLGRLGFLADLALEEFQQNFAAIRERQFHIAEHVMFECTIHREDGSTETCLGLNEAALCAEATLQMIEVSLTIDDFPVTRYSCDGLIISTPVGSTAHSLSAGGPAIRQDLPVFVVTPICPHTLSNRSLVDHAERTYRLGIDRSRSDAILVVDGQIRRHIGRRDEIEIRRASDSFQLARLSGHNYFDVLEKKLGWSGQPRYTSREREE